MVLRRAKMVKNSVAKRISPLLDKAIKAHQARLIRETGFKVSYVQASASLVKYIK